MRSADDERPRPIRDLLRRLIKAPAAFSVLWPALLIIGGYVAWHRWGSVHVAARYSGIDPTRIEITPPPEYVRSNIVKAVYRDTAMEGLSLLDRQATAKIAAAFSMHPLIRQVTGVRKLPGGTIDVRLEYRSPVAMVHVFKPDRNDTRSYFFPVDGEGILLPDTEFAPAEIPNYLYIEIPDVYSTNDAGTPFGDRRVEAAARLAEILQPLRDQAMLRSIGVHGGSWQSDTPQLELTTDSGARLFWGSPPGSELPGEPTVTMKLRTLLAVDKSQNADLRMAGGVTLQR
ncbi:MAG: hypothetical protein AAGG48_12265 [Planctomycetota bacterium]